MRYGMRFLCGGAAAATSAGTAMATSDLAKLEVNPFNWAAPAGDFALHRHSKLKRINKGDVHRSEVS